jgi:ribonuclease D
MLEYAAMDGRYLIPLARILKQELEEKGRLAWVEEECLYLSRVRFTPSDFGPLYPKVKGAAQLDPRSLTVLEALLQLREAEARKADRPPFMIVRNESLLDLALRKPLSLEELGTGKALSQKQVDRFGSGLLSEIQRAMAIEDEDLLKAPKHLKPVWPSPVHQRIKALKKWRDRRAEHLELESGILLSNSLINALALKNPRSLAEMEGIPGLKRWLLDYFGQEILGSLTSQVRVPVKIT